MRLLNRSNGERNSLSPFLWFFLLMGIVLSAIATGGEKSLETLFQNGGVMDLKAGSFNEKGFFMHVLFLRLSYMLGIIILSTTTLRKFFLLAQPAILCLGMGAWLGAAISQYGIKGILLVLAASFPHVLIYIVVIRFLLMVLWERTSYDKQFYIAIFILCFGVIIGCLFESYVNPMIVTKIINYF